ncbi:MAG TPA: DUF1697 domain-containing protein [Burkholderiaceae bacterium]
MTTYIALLRAVNVGGTGKLPMAELKAMAVELGFDNVRTYIASGNLLFDSKLSAAKAGALLAARLQQYAGKPVGVIMRTAAEMADVRDAFPFKDAAGNRAVVVFLDAAPPADALEHIKGQQDEECALGPREIFIHYGSGMGQSKFEIKAAKAGTARNLNTVAKLADMAGA